MSASSVQRDNARYTRFINTILTVLLICIIAYVISMFYTNHHDPRFHHNTYTLTMLTVSGPVDDADVIDYNLTPDDCLAAYRAHAPIVTPTMSITYRCDYIA